MSEKDQNQTPDNKPEKPVVDPQPENHHLKPHRRKHNFKKLQSMLLISNVLFLLIGFGLGYIAFHDNHHKRGSEFKQKFDRKHNNFRGGPMQGGPGVGGGFNGGDQQLPNRQDFPQSAPGSQSAPQGETNQNNGERVLPRKEQSSGQEAPSSPSNAPNPEVATK